MIAAALLINPPWEMTANHKINKQKIMTIKIKVEKIMADVRSVWKRLIRLTKILPWLLSKASAENVPLVQSSGERLMVIVYCPIPSSKAAKIPKNQRFLCDQAMPAERFKMSR